MIPVAARRTPSPAPLMTSGAEYSLRTTVTFSVPLIQKKGLSGPTPAS